MADGKRWVQHLITIETSPVVRLWTGYDRLSIGGHSYEGGGKALSISEAETTSGDPDRRMTLTLSGIPTDTRRKFLQDVGPLPAMIEWIYSNNSGASWQKIPLSFRGRLSTPAFSDGTFQIEIETLRGDVDRGRPLRWSHEDQQRRFPEDKGLEHMRTLAQQGVETGWPP